MTMVKPAHASGTVIPVLNRYIVTGNGFANYANLTDISQACFPMGGVTPDITLDSPGRWKCSYPYPNGTFWIAYVTYIGPVCPAYSTGTTTCTCTDPYVPDSSGTICVAENSCPQNMSGSPCACNAGYELNPSGAGCSLVEYALTLSTDPLDKVAPSGTAIVIATVEKIVAGQMSPKSDVLVNVKVDVEAGSGGHDHDEGRHVPPYTGILSAATGTTGPDGTVSFTFDAPKVSGTHNFTAACISVACTNNPATTHIDVKVDNLIQIPDSPLYALQDSKGKVIGAIPGKHTGNHYLTATAIDELKSLAILYTTVINPNAVLYLNDASLKWGGLFDVGSTPWESPHSLHDRGVSLDFRAENSGPNNEGAVPASLFLELVNTAKKNGFRIGLHCKNSSNTNYCLGQPNNRHFHVNF